MIVVTMPHLIHTVILSFLVLSFRNANADTTPGPKFFSVTGNSEFTCSVAGATCAFVRSDFVGINVEGSVISETIGNSIKSFEDTEVDKLILAGCAAGVSPCIVTCQSFCECQLTASGDPCEEVTLPPTPSPTAPDISPTPSPEPPNCATKRMTEECPNLMPTLLAGFGQDCSCLNFCNGAFLSCCEEDTDTCGNLNCEPISNATVPGLVQGCNFVEHSQNNSNDGSSSSAIPSIVIIWVLAMASWSLAA